MVPASRLIFLLVELLGRMRSDHVSYFPPLPQPVGERGRKPKRGAELAFEVEATQPVPSVTTVTAITHYGKAVATARDRLHPLLVRRSAWAGHSQGDLRNPWERPARHGRLTPVRVRRGFRCLHGKTPQPANAPNPTTAVPGRPIGTKNKHRAREHPVGKQDKPNLAGAIAGSRAAKNANSEGTASFTTEFGSRPW